MKRTLLVALILLSAAVTSRLLGQGGKNAVVNSHHDFRAGSSATVHALSEQDACVFCHTPHRTGDNPSDNGTYLWNQRSSSTTFSGYASSTLQSQVPGIAPQDVSKLCLSCHDGSIALGDTMSDGLIEFVQGPGYTLPASDPANVSGLQGFSNDHPFGFVPTLSTNIVNPAPGDAVRLDDSGKIQCTTCHEPHQENRDTTEAKFLVKSNRGSAICLSCHQQPGWTGSAHFRPTDPAEDARYGTLQGAHTGYTGVADNGCQSCHRSHAPQVAQRLIKYPEENTCFACHDGSVDTKNLKAEFLSKAYKHPVLLTPSTHDDSESPLSALYPMPEIAVGAPRHAECVDCHNSHQARPGTALPPSISGPLQGVRGQSAANGYLPQAANEYEVCFKCHGDSANRPQATDNSIAGVGFGRNPQRQFNAGNPNAFNTRMEFTTLASFHPVTRPRDLAAGPGGDVPSLRSSVVSAGGAPILGRTLNAGSQIYCMDCHNSDTGSNLGAGTLPAGPHGSNIAHLLERQNVLEPPPARPGGASAGASYSPANYALCDKCHDVQGKVMADVTFKHRLHVQEQSAACSTCHDPHASSAALLINFDLSIVGANSRGVLSYTRTGTGHGTCNLACHGENHDGASY